LLLPYSLPICTQAVRLSESKNPRFTNDQLVFRAWLGLYNKSSFRAIRFCRQYARDTQSVRSSTFGLPLSAKDFNEVKYNYVGQGLGRIENAAKTTGIVPLACPFG
jgi:hypothetical protein